MSTEEQDAIIGRAIREHAQEKQRLEEMFLVADRIGEMLQTIGAALRASGRANNIHHGYIPAELDQMPSSEQLRSLCNDIVKCLERVSTLQVQLQNLGLPWRSGGTQ